MIGQQGYELRVSWEDLGLCTEPSHVPVFRDKDALVLWAQEGHHRPGEELLTRFQEVFPASVVSHIASAEDHQHTKVWYLGVACSEPHY